MSGALIQLVSKGVQDVYQYYRIDRITVADPAILKRDVPNTG